MKFRTEIKPLEMQGAIRYDSPIFMAGSCFTDEIGRQLSYRIFDVAVNPFGTLYNPESIALAMEEAIDGKIYRQSDLIVNEGRYHSFSRHSDFSGYDPVAVVKHLNESLSETAMQLSLSKVIILTFGSSLAFRHKASGLIVANCHKIPASEFTLEELSVDDIALRWKSLIARLCKINPDLKVILTVSPVRHAGYGLIADRLSKSRLLLACSQLASDLGNVMYFPSYEIMVDDLRDYRFYAGDLVHPSAMAVEYIYEIFSLSFMDEATRITASRWKKLTDRAFHRFPPGSPHAAGFQDETMRLARQLASESGAPEQFNRFKELLSKCQSI